MTSILQKIDDDPITRIKTGDRKYLRSLYDENRDAFVQWVKGQYGTDQDLAMEIYQSAFTALYYNVREGKITELKSQLKTYLFAIGRNQLRDRYKLEKKYIDVPENFASHVEADHNVMDKYDRHHLKTKVGRLLDKIGEPCRTVLRLYYYNHYSMEAIAAHMNYKTEQVAAKRKFLCLKQLREMMPG